MYIRVVSGPFHEPTALGVRNFNQLVQEKNDLAAVLDNANGNGSGNDNDSDNDKLVDDAAAAATAAQRERYTLLVAATKAVPTAGLYRRIAGFESVNSHVIKYKHFFTRYVITLPHPRTHTHTHIHTRARTRTHTHAHAHLFICSEAPVGCVVAHAPSRKE